MHRLTVTASEKIPRAHVKEKCLSVLFFKNPSAASCSHFRFDTHLLVFEFSMLYERTIFLLLIFDLNILAELRVVFPQLINFRSHKDFAVLMYYGVRGDLVYSLLPWWYRSPAIFIEHVPINQIHAHDFSACVMEPGASIVNRFLHAAWKSRAFPVYSFDFLLLLQQLQEKFCFGNVISQEYVIVSVVHDLMWLL